MKLTVKQKVVSLKEKFQVMDTEGNPVYEVAGKVISIGHKLTVYDMDKNPVAHLHQKVISLVPKYFIEVEGYPEVELKGHITLLHDHYTLETHRGNWEIRGDIAQHEYNITKDKEVIAQVTQKFFTWGDTYMLDVADDEDALTALCVMIAIDCVHSDTHHAESRTIAGTD